MKRVSLQRDAVIRCRCLYLLVLLAFALAQTSMAFQVTTTSRLTPSTALQAWSLPHETSFTFRTWYNEYNPTARVTVYNDPDPIERYSFVTVGSDWPSMLDSSVITPQPTRNHKRYANPIKRAWRRRTLRRMLAAARRSYGIVEK